MLAGDLSARINFIGISPESQIIQPRNIICMHTRAVVCKKANTLAHFAQSVDSFKRTLYFLIADVDGAVEVKYK